MIDPDQNAQLAKAKGTFETASATARSKRTYVVTAATGLNNLLDRVVKVEGIKKDNRQTID
jgi:hypothetical protein